MIQTVSAGTPVKSGYYFGLKSWTVHPTARDGEALPGDERWLPVSLPLALAAAPLLGAAFLMFMPAIGLVLVAMAFARPVTNLFRRTTTEFAATMSPGLVAGEAHLTGKRGAREVADEAIAGEERELDALQAEIDARRASRG
jgi:hypothetical protein